MRLTADLIGHSLSYLNPLKEREMLLRGAFFLNGKGDDTALVGGSELISKVTHLSLPGKQATEYPLLRIWV
jgi:hypothetical protein